MASFRITEKERVKVICFGPDGFEEANSGMPLLALALYTDEGFDKERWLEFLNAALACERGDIEPLKRLDDKWQAEHGT